MNTARKPLQVGGDVLGQKSPLGSIAQLCLSTWIRVENSSQPMRKVSTMRTISARNQGMKRIDDLEAECRTAVQSVGAARPHRSIFDTVLMHQVFMTTSLETYICSAFSSLQILHVAMPDSQEGMCFLSTQSVVVISHNVLTILSCSVRSTPKRRPDGRRK